MPPCPNWNDAPSPEAPSMSWTPLSSRDRAVVVLPALVTFAIALWKIGEPSYWRDESVSVVLRPGSLGQPPDFLRATHAAHALYSLFLHAATLFGTSPTGTPPSS